MWRIIISRYRKALRLALIFNGGLLTLQFLAHGGLHWLEESQHPTPTSWPWTTRYYLRRARIPNSWNPFGEKTPDDERLQLLNDAIADIEKQGLHGWGEVQVRKERGECLERLKRWEEAEGDYKAALEALTEAPAVKVEAAHRLARIREWKEDAIGALEALEVGLKAAEGNEVAKLKAKAEMAVFLARQGELGKALELATEVLVARKAAAKEVLPGEERRFTEKIGDPCMIAAAEAMVGELVFALGKREEGVRWTEDAFTKAWPLVDLRLACKECAGVTAGNVVKMAAIMEKAAEGENEGWRWFWKGNKEAKLNEARRLKGEYELRGLEVEAVKSVKDAEIAKAR